MFEFKISYTWKGLPWIYWCKADSGELAMTQFYFDNDFENEIVDILSVEQF